MPKKLSHFVRCFFLKIFRRKNTVSKIKSKMRQTPMPNAPIIKLITIGHPPPSLDP